MDLSEIETFLTIVNIHLCLALYGVYIITGMLFGLLGGTISIGKYLKKQAKTPLSKVGSA